MPDEYVKVTRTSWGQNIAKSIIGVLFGIVLFIVSFVVLWNSEGRVNLGSVAENAIVVGPESPEPSANGKLVAITGPLTISKPVGDPKYLKPGNHVMLKRHVEMYAWIEESETKTEKKTGGETVEKTTYRYHKDWTSSPGESSNFEIPEGHYNPRMDVTNETFYATDVKIGSYGFDVQEAGMPSGKRVRLTRSNAKLSYRTELIGSDYIYVGDGNYEYPYVGDLRISYNALGAGTKVTLFGKKDDSDIVAYYHQGKTRLYRALTGTKDEAVVALKTEHKVMGWILRIVGFVLMWIGLSALFGPITAVMDVLPFLGKVGRGIFGIITFVTALILSVITIVLSMVFHNTIALIIFIVVIIAVIVLIIMSRKKKS